MAAPPTRRAPAAGRRPTGITIETRARFGCTAPAGSTDDGRFRRLTVHLPAEYAQALFNARDQGATEDQPRAIVAQGLQGYFKDGGSRAGNLEVSLTNIDYLDVAFRRLHQLQAARELRRSLAA
ncbi:hypothetical protein SDIAM26S_00943 [Streptomyces diastaticus subsp. diastaticus]